MRDAVSMVGTLDPLLMGPSPQAQLDARSHGQFYEGQNGHSNLKIDVEMKVAFRSHFNGFFSTAQPCIGWVSRYVVPDFTNRQSIFAREKRRLLGCTHVRIKGLSDPS